MVLWEEWNPLAVSFVVADLCCLCIFWFPSDTSGGEHGTSLKDNDGSDFDNASKVSDASVAILSEDSGERSDPEAPAAFVHSNVPLGINVPGVTSSFYQRHDR